MYRSPETKNFCGTHSMLQGAPANDKHVSEYDQVGQINQFDLQESGVIQTPHKMHKNYVQKIPSGWESSDEDEQSPSTRNPVHQAPAKPNVRHLDDCVYTRQMHQVIPNKIEAYNLEAMGLNKVQNRLFDTPEKAKFNVKDDDGSSRYQDSTAYATHRQMIIEGKNESASKFLFKMDDSEPLKKMTNIQSKIDKLQIDYNEFQKTSSAKNIR